MSAHSQFDWAGVIFWVIVSAMCFGAAYWAWPDGVTDKPIASLALRDVFWLIGSLVAGLFGVGGVVGAIRDANEPL